MNARALRTLIGVLLVLLSSSCAAEALAERARVSLTVLGTASELERLRTALATDTLGDVALEWAVEDRWDPGALLDEELPPSIKVACWVDLTRPARAELYFKHRARGRFLLREVPLEDGLDELGRETLAQVLEMSIRALLSDEQAGMTREEAALELDRRRVPERRAAPRSVPAPRRAAPAASRGLGVAPFYAVRADSGAAPLAHGPGVALGWFFGPSSLRASAWATGQYELRRSVVTPSVGLELSTLVLRAAFELNQTLRESFELGGRAGVGVNVLSLEPTEGSSEERVSLSSVRGAAELVIEIGFQGCRRLGRHFGACARVFSDVHPERIRYGLERNGRVAYVLEPWVVRPGFALSLLLR